MRQRRRWRRIDDVIGYQVIPETRSGPGRRSGWISGGTALAEATRRWRLRSGGAPGTVPARTAGLLPGRKCHN